MGVDFLSESYFEAIQDALDADPAVRDGLRKVTEVLTMRNVVSDCPGGGELTYHVVIAPERITFAPGDLAGADLTIRYRYADGVAIDKGELNRQIAMMKGKVRIEGSITRLLKVAKPLSAVERATKTVPVAYP